MHQFINNIENNLLPLKQREGGRKRKRNTTLSGNNLINDKSDE